MRVKRSTGEKEKRGRATLTLTPDSSMIFQKSKGNLITRKLGVLLLAFCVMVAPFVVNAQDVEEVVAQAEEDAGEDVNGCLWFGVGFILSIFGVAVSYSWIPSPRAERFLGKSPDYVMAYRDAYEEKARSYQLFYATGGCFTSGLGFLMFIAVMENAASQLPF